MGHARAVERKESKKENMERMEGKGGWTEKRKRERGRKSHQGASKLDTFIMHSICKR